MICFLEGKGSSLWVDNGHMDGTEALEEQLSLLKSCERRAQDCAQGPLTQTRPTPLQWTWSWALQLPCRHCSPQSRRGMPASPGKCLTFCRRSLTQGLWPVALFKACSPNSPLPGPSCVIRMVGSGERWHLEDGCPAKTQPWRDTAFLQGFWQWCSVPETPGLLNRGVGCGISFYRRERTLGPAVASCLHPPGAGRPS